MIIHISPLPSSGHGQLRAAEEVRHQSTREGHQHRQQDDRQNQD